MNTVRWIISTAPEIFLLLAVAIGTIFGRVKIRGFAIGTTACTLIVAVLIGQLGTFTFPPMLRVVLFSLFVFTIGYRSGPEFFASLSVRTLAQVAMALVLGGTGLAIVLSFAFIFSLDPGTASGLAAGALTQSSVIGTASGALAQLGLPKNVLEQQEANIAAGYAVGSEFSRRSRRAQAFRPPFRGERRASAGHSCTKPILPSGPFFQTYQT